MSFCRFTDNNCRCDFYAYESEGGFRLHVAASRVVWDAPPDPFAAEVVLSAPEEWWARMVQTWRQALTEAKRKAITLDGAGESHIFETLPGVRECIADHIGRGFQAPDWLLESLDEEIAEGT